MSLDQGPSPLLDELLKLERERSEIMPEAVRGEARDALARTIAKELHAEARDGAKGRAGEPAPSRPVTWRAAAASPKVLALVVASMSAGFLAGRATAPAHEPGVAVTPSEASASATMATASEPPRAPSATAHAVPFESLPTARSSGEAPHTKGGGDVAAARETRERTLLERAREALARRAHDEALATLAEHRAAFPEGSMAEERELLAIRALDEAGRGRDARERARQFLTRYPTSVFAAKARRVAERDGGP